MSNVQMYMCSVTLLQKISSRVKSNKLLGQGIGPANPTQHLGRCSSTFIPINHDTQEFELLIANKQNPHRDINQLAVTAKIISQPGLQLCVVSVGAQSWQTEFRGLNERFP
jgi:hypothetical protein